MLFVFIHAMEIYLIRHTTPDIKKGTCYGQADLDTVHSFLDEAACIEKHLPLEIDIVFSSPLKRCRQLAEHLFPAHNIHFDDRIKEINCGEWELQLWDDLDQDLIREWRNDFVNVCIPGGESYQQLYNRAVQFFEQLPSDKQRIAIVSHGGVMRSLLTYIEKVDLKDSFQVFSLRYGCVVKVQKQPERFIHSVLHNPVTEQEQHRPSYS